MESEPSSAWQPLPDDEQAIVRRVGHTLNNELALIMGYLAILRRKLPHLSTDEATTRLQELEGYAVDMHTTLESFMRLNKIQHTEPEIGPLHMADAVDLARRSLSDRIQWAGAVLNTPAIWPVVVGDLYWVRDVWVVYLSNALKYGGSPPHITLGAEAPNGHTLRFWVRDNGAGITPEMQTGLFRPFYWPTPRRTGVGLGLYTARVIITKLGGTVSAQNVEGQGSEFSFTLPVAP